MRWQFWRRDQDLDRELAAHLEIEEEVRRRDGLSADEARHAARRELGNVTRVKETVHEMSPLAALEGWLGDLRYSVRSLIRNPGFAVVAVLVLALGIGAATAIFTIADQALLRVLPVKDPAQVKLLTWQGTFIGGSSRGYRESFSYPLFRELEQEMPAALASVAARFQTNVSVDTGSGGGRATVELVSGGYFPTLGAAAAMGRTLGPEDDEVRDAEPWVVLSHAYWRTRLGADPKILNRTILVNGHRMTVIGVAERGFVGLDKLRPTDLFVPMQMKTAVTPTWDDRDRRNSIWLNIFIRLAPGVGLEQAAAAFQGPYAGALRRDLAAFPRESEEANRYLENHLELTDAAQGFDLSRRMLTKPLHVLLGMVGLLLLIACVNVAGLLVVRSAKREKEIAVRCSLGASRLAIVRLVLVECLLLSVAGAGLGLVFARLGAAGLVRMVPANGLGAALRTTPDLRILAFTVALAALTALVFGLVPAFHTARSSASPALRHQSSAVSLGRRHARLRRTLVAGQIALSLLLLAIAGLFGKSLNRIFDADSGMAVEHLLSFAVVPVENGYTPERARRFALELQRRLESLPSVRSASAATAAVLTRGRMMNSVKAEDQKSPDEIVQAGSNQVLPGFFSTAGIQLLDGRDFTERDTVGAPVVLIVNEAFAKHCFDSPEKALGRHVGYFFDKAPLPYEIVGIVADHRPDDLREEPEPRTYWSLLANEHPGQMTFYLRATGDPGALAGAAERALHEIDPSMVAFDMKTVEHQLDDSYYVERLFARLSAVFAVLATLLAAIGLYGVAAFSVARRTHEIGVRMALGAQRGRIFGMVQREALVLAGVGMLVGAPLAWAAGKLVESQLYGVAAVDAGVSVAAVVALLAASALAGYLPARRATRISPAKALRHE